MFSKKVLIQFLILCTGTLACAYAYGKTVIRKPNLEREAYVLEIIDASDEPYYLPVWNGEYPITVASSSFLGPLSGEDVVGCKKLRARVLPEADADYYWEVSPETSGVFFQPSDDETIFCSLDEAEYDISVYAVINNKPTNLSIFKIKTTKLIMGIRTCTCAPTKGVNFQTGLGENIKVQFSDPQVNGLWRKEGPGLNAPSFSDSRNYNYFESKQTTTEEATIIIAEVNGETFKLTISAVIGPNGQKSFGVVPNSTYNEAVDVKKGPPNVSVGAGAYFNVQFLPTTVCFDGTSLRENIPIIYYEWPSTYLT